MSGVAKDQVQAVIVPHSKQGHSIHDVDYVDATNIADFEPDEGRKQETARRLRSLGFDVLDHGGPTLLVQGPKSLFENTFDDDLEEHFASKSSPYGEGNKHHFFRPRQSATPGLLRISPESHPELASHARGLAISEPVLLSQAPAKSAPKVNYYHVDVPDGLRACLNVGAAHRAGITGRGVKVALCDSGFYAHPWFNEQGLSANVVLAPGASSPETDEVGHGTMVAANLFSIAPACDVTMIKMNFLAGGSIGAIPALELAARSGAQVINCSWGESVAGPDLSASNRALEYVVTWLASTSRIVLCAAGNYPRTDPKSEGEFGFPAQHPNAIAVGGALVKADGSAAAASYASGFPSQVYRHRNVPDVCGLCGDLPSGVLILVPMQPGCIIDKVGAAKPYPNGDETEPDDGWAGMSGTSAAAPQVSGIAAMMLQVNPEMTDFAKVRSVLELTARDVVTGTSNPRASTKGAGYPATRGTDVATGAGIVDGSAAVLLAQMLRRMNDGPEGLLQSVES